MTSTIRFSVRELRHIANRLLHARGVHRNMVNPVRDVLVFAQASGFDALAELERTADLVAGYTGGVTVDAGGDIDAGGQAAYFVAPAVFDVAAIRASDVPRTITLHAVDGPEVFAALGEYAAVRGLRLVECVRADDSVILTVTTAPVAALAPIDAEGPAVRRALTENLVADADRFWRLFHASDQALTPDSEESRNHAGTQIHDEHGNVIGEWDEEGYEYIREFAG
jgi:hypothetical protein